MIVDLTLDRLRLPALENFTPAFGQKEASGGVSTENVCNDVMLPFSRQRPIVLTENSTTKADATRGDVQADCRLEFSQAGLTFALGAPSCAGIKAEFIGGFSTSGTSSVSYTATSGAATKTVSAGQKVTLVATTALAWEEKELFQGGCVLASSSSIAGPTLAIGDIVKVMFTSDLTAVDGTTALGLSYNGTSFPVKASSGGSLVGLFAHEVTSGTFKYLQAYTTLELVFDGTNFVVVGNPVVLSGADYTIYADGYCPQWYASPDWSRKVALSFTGYNYTAPSDGWIVGFYCAYIGTTTNLYINSAPVSVSQHFGNDIYFYGNIQTKISKGDVLSFTGSFSSVSLYFVPHK